MTERKTLKLPENSGNAEGTALKKKGRRWEISEKRLDVVKDPARDMLRQSSAEQKLLAISLQRSVG